jgi:hypothetical protein
MTPKPAREAGPWYHQPVALGLVVLVAVVILNIIFW